MPSIRRSPIVMRTPPISEGSTAVVTSNVVRYAAARRWTNASSSAFPSGRALTTRSSCAPRACRSSTSNCSTIVSAMFSRRLRIKSRTVWSAIGWSREKPCATIVSFSLRSTTGERKNLRTVSSAASASTNPCRSRPTVSISPASCASWNTAVA
ncbi:MAG TPA: hypothetical protein VGC96_02325 [Candidatus Elarobacter sp.]